MWIGSIRLVVLTENAQDAGTDHLVTATLLRDGAGIYELKLDYADENDLERGATRAYDYYNLPRRNHRTPELPPGVGQSPMPYPNHGVEFSDGLNGHLKLRLKIHGDDMWIKDEVRLYVREVRQQATSFDTVAWVEQDAWSLRGSWPRDVAMSRDDDEGCEVWTLTL